MAVSPKRRYRMTARAESVADTERRILVAAGKLFVERQYDDVRLQDIAEAAGVSPATIVHRFGSKDGVFVAAAQASAPARYRYRNEAPIGDVAGAVQNVVGLYEHGGDMLMHFLRQEQRIPLVRERMDTGRTFHAGWVERTFAPQLECVAPAKRHVRLAQLIALTDIYMWFLLRRQRGLSREETEAAIAEMITALAEKEH